MSRSGQPPDLKKYMDKKLQIKLNANRMVVGTLRGFDQFMNLVVDNTVEVNGNEKTDIGMVVVRGNSVVTVEALEPYGKGRCFVILNLMVVKSVPVFKESEATVPAEERRDSFLTSQSF
ncbi:hypothetical protein TIFTF001_008674 [Ficus carica]|uniref:Small nuclear ribonucleoprotein G n=1 Tax=Ficus carica TaxID=3494 RepID=A0AA88A917_FICCA|nr:hypothetical protein TIFTF001_008674 [Ficus carica]